MLLILRSTETPDYVVTLKRDMTLERILLIGTTSSEDSETLVLSLIDETIKIGA
jgi:hypothetical protein